MPKHKRDKEDSEKKKTKYVDVSSKRVYYLIHCICASCNTLNAVLVGVKKLPAQVVELLEKLRTMPSNALDLSEWESVVTQEEAMQRLGLLYLMTKKHSCLNGILLDKYPNFGMDVEHAEGLLLKRDQLSNRARFEDATPILHLLNTNKFVVFPKKSALLILTLSVSKEMLLIRPVSQKKKKKAKKVTDSVSLSE
jgi:hypothetical protein